MSDMIRIAEISEALRAMMHAQLEEDPNRDTEDLTTELFDLARERYPDVTSEEIVAALHMTWVRSYENLLRLEKAMGMKLTDKVESPYKAQQ